MKISEGSKIIDLLPRDVCRAAVLLSFILSLWVSFTGGIVNLDGILYLNVADLLGKGDFSGAAELYGWFFYPLLIAGVHKISGFGLEMSAHLLTALFSALLTYAFLACVRELGGNRKILFLAAIIIIFHPVFMEFRAKIFRDHGYLAFYLLGVLCFLKFYGLPLWRYAFLWGLSMLVATLFRIEGLLFLSMLPTAIIFNKSFTLSKRLYHFARAHLVNFGLLAVVVILRVTNPEVNLLETGRLGDPLLLFGNFFSIMGGGLAGKIDVLKNLILVSHSDEYAVPVLLSIPFMILLDKLFATLTALYVIALVWHPLRSVTEFKRGFLPVLTWLVTLNIVMLIIFLFVNFFLQKRFVFPLALIFMLLLPFIFDTYLDKWKALTSPSLKQRVLCGLVVVILLFNCLDGLFTIPGRSKYYIKDAGLWLKNNISPHATLYTNNSKIYYYSGHMDGYWEIARRREKISPKLIAETPWRDCEYIVLWVTKESKKEIDKLSLLLGSEPIKIFSNGRQDKVLIYVAKPIS